MSLFTPVGDTVNVSASSTTGNVALGSAGKTIRVKNLSADTAVFIKFGASDVEATAAAGIPIGPGDIAGFTRGAETHVAAITASGTASVYFTPGEGE